MATRRIDNVLAQLDIRRPLIRVKFAKRVSPLLWRGDVMEQYSTFAEVYDTFMDNVPYDEWIKNIARNLKEHKIDDGLVLDLGCGTGTVTEGLAALGYDMIGVDSSEDMLAIAMEKNVKSGFDILYLCQDIVDFELYGTVRAIVSCCDTLNYITEKEDLLQVFKWVNNYLEPDGVFIFDVNSEYKYEELLADNTFAENRDDSSFIWENTFDNDSRINEYALTLFIKEEDDLYRKHEEFHYQRAYSKDELADLLKKAGLKIESIKETEDRLYYTVTK